MNRLELQLPRPMMVGTIYKFWRSEVNYEKSRLLALSMGREAHPYVRPDDDVLVNSDTVATEFGMSRRTLTRRIKEFNIAEAAKHTAEQASAHV